MPAIRSTPAAKPVKTERSHEENQERYADTDIVYNAAGV
jgi:hypothetical protein